MNVFHYDTETDGLNISGQPSNHPDQPGVVSLTASLDDPDGNQLDVFSTLVQPIRPINPEAQAIHGITYERAMDEGIPMHAAMARVEAMVQMADTLSAFNHFFDYKMLKIGCARMPSGGDALRQMLETKSAICTMNSARKFLQAGRFIKLGVAYEKLFGESFANAHTSMADMEAHRRIFYHLRRIGHLEDPKPLTPRKYDGPPPPYVPKASKPAPAPMTDRESALRHGLPPARSRLKPPAIKE